MGRNFKEKKNNRQITADGASEDGEMNRSWVGTSWSSPKKYYTADGGVFGCRPVETVDTPYAVVSE